MTGSTDVVVIGGGQAGLAAGYHLRRLRIEHVILDAQAAAGGAWQHTWPSSTTPPHAAVPSTKAAPTAAALPPSATWSPSRPYELPVTPDS